MSTHDTDGSTRTGSRYDAGTVATRRGRPSPERFENPGLPEHRHRMADTDPRAAKRAERQVAAMFGLSALGTIAHDGRLLRGAARPRARVRRVHGPASGSRTSSSASGCSSRCSSSASGAVHWAKTLMPDDERVEYRHLQRGTDEERADAVRILKEGAEESGLGRRPLLRNSLLGAMALLPLPAVVLLRDTGPLPERRPVDDVLGARHAARRSTPPGEPVQGLGPHDRLGRAHHARGHRGDRAPARRAGQGRGPARPPQPGGPGRGVPARGVRRDRRLLQDLHAHGLPGGALRAADAPPAVPVPPVDVRPDAELQGHLRPGEAAPAPTADHAWTTRDTWWPRAASTKPSARASGSADEYHDQRQGRRARPATSSTSASARPGSSRRAPARSSRTTGRSCSARSRSTASSSCC